VTRTLPAAPAGLISTPDQRLHVFVSSTLGELAEERESARATISGMRLTPVMFEAGARAHPPRELYRAYLAQSDIFVGIYWRSYGWVAPGEEVSGLEDEYALAGDRPKLIYVKAATDREPRLAALLERIQADDRVSYKHFEDAAELAELLADDLAIVLTERFTRSTPAAPGSLRAAPLPVPATPIVGRDGEVDAVVALLRQPSVRLVTLIGPGGIGKTRLALAVAGAVGGAEDLDGVWFVDLAAVSDPALVPEAIGARLGVRPEWDAPVLDLLVERLRGRRVLLVLDNVEQVQAAASDVARLLAECPGLRLLVTSRTALRLRGEQEISLTPLPTPAAGDVSVETVARSAAVELFVARARQVRPGFVLTAGNAAAVAELCRRLDGIPLALELAAAQLRVLSPAALLARLTERMDRSLDLATGPVDLPDRQRTLRAAVDWSYSLLGEPERALLSRLSVFVGTFTFPGAEAVGGVDDDVDVLATLSSLVTQSLVALDDRDPDEPRFRLLEAVRLFAAEKLAERGEQAASEARLTHYLIGFAERAGAGMSGPDNRRWAALVDAELDDVRATIQRAVAADDAETAVRIAAPLFIYWWSHGLLAAMSTLAETAAGLPSAARLPADAAVQLCWARAMFRISAGRTGKAVPMLRQVLETATELGDARLGAHALAGLGLASASTEADDAPHLLDRAVDQFRRAGDLWGLAYALSTRGQLALQAGEPAVATAMHTEALAAAERIDNDHLRAQLRDLLGFDALAAGDVSAARMHLAAAADVHMRLLDQEGSAYCLDGLAAVALAQGKPDVAARLLGASDHARDVVGVSVWPWLQPITDAQTAAVRGATGAAEFRQLSTEGARLSAVDALVYGLTATGTDDRPPDP
jgi:predicted ATPase